MPKSSAQRKFEELLEARLTSTNLHNTGSVMAWAKQHDTTKRRKRSFGEGAGRVPSAQRLHISPDPARALRAAQVRELPPQVIDAAALYYRTEREHTMGDFNTPETLDRVSGKTARREAADALRFEALQRYFANK